MRIAFLSGLTVGLLACSSAWSAEPAADGYPIVARWCERNAGARSVFVRFGVHEYDDTLKIAKAGVGECRVDPHGLSYLRIRPRPGMVARRIDYQGKAIEPQNNCWTADRWYANTASIPQAPTPDSVPLEQGLLAESDWPGKFGAELGPRHQVPFLPGLESWEVLSRYTFVVHGRKGDLVFVEATPRRRMACGFEFNLIGLLWGTTDPVTPAYVDELLLAFQADSFELRAVKLQTVHRSTTYVFDPPDVMPSPDKDSAPVGLETAL